ncbi:MULTISPECIES: TonB family protein [unclassified Neisseria]|uniref:TonB family protein n=1 Tax=unclassified Neisseria TaxID=2623750 RepID=UPI002666F759|nr:MULTISPECIES: TonB family protein [unclassified Neisseria]MDO1509353.1 TonB family protein [Neisseria sp. MVDL19-042950]MDO1515368.1 TonB family protein [Neisseria sp. MVDL18-041461]MDO1562728.1 TonB family protein [Neisseria sp. MVDL20-010259]
MNTRRILSTLTAFALLAGSQAALAEKVSFYQRASEASAPISGNVAMRLTIGIDGAVSNARVVRSSGSKVIDADAVKWMEAQFMRPVTKNGDPIEFSVVKEINFSTSPAIQVSLKR